MTRLFVISSGFPYRGNYLFRFFLRPTIPVMVFAPFLSLAPWRGILFPGRTPPGRWDSLISVPLLLQSTLFFDFFAFDLPFLVFRPFGSHDPTREFPLP